MPKYSKESGVVPILVILAAVGLIVFLLVTNIFSFKNSIFSRLFPKPSSFASNPTDTSYDMGVLVLKYFPLTADGQNIDINYTGDVGDPYSTIHQRTVNITSNLLTDIPKATSYLGYKDATAAAALRYNVVDTVEHNTYVPFDPVTRKALYNQIMTDHNICDYVNNRGVSEVWLFAYQGPAYPGGTANAYLDIAESKMSGPFGDISNSNRTNDMPQCGKTYRVYTFNYGRGTAEAIHSWGHQMEAELSAVDTNLFRNLFQGPNYPQTLGVNGRCGSVHNPPNARSEYDWANTTSQKSDCMDWKPDSLGALSDISCLTWNHNPGCADVSDSDNSQLDWMVWLWQNLPGRNNTKTYQGAPLRNWWDIHGAFDKVMGTDRSLLVNPLNSRILASSPLVADSFNRADSTSGLGVADTGQTWQATQGSFGRSNNQAYPTSCGSYAVIDSGNSDGQVQVTLAVNAQDARIPFRMVDANNYYFVERDGTGYHMEKVINGTRNFLTSDSSYTPKNGDVVKIQFSGSSIKVLVNDVVKLQLTDTSLNGTKHGIGTYCNTAMRFDDFSFTNYLSSSPAPSATPTNPSPTPIITPNPTPTPILISLSAPTNLVARGINNSQIQLNWSDTNTRESGYTIERSLSATSGFKQVHTVGVNSTSYKDGGLKRLTTYYYRVRAYGPDNTFSSYSNVVSATTTK